MPDAFTVGHFLLRIRPAPLAVCLKRLLRIRRTVVETAEGRFWVDPASDAGQRIHREGCYDAPSIALLHTHLAAGDTYLDVGANEGYLCVAASQTVGPTGRVIAIEPQARLQEVLRRNLALNGCAAQILQVAISDHTGTAEMHLTPDVNNSASGLHARTRYPLSTQTVPLLTLAQLFEQLHLPDDVFVKMDIESFEYEAILGSPELFRTRRISRLMLELHPESIRQRGLDPDAVPRFLTACGYAHMPGTDGRLWTALRSA